MGLPLNLTQSQFHRRSRSFWQQTQGSQAMGALYPNAIPQWECLSWKYLMDCKAIPHQVCWIYVNISIIDPPPTLPPCPDKLSYRCFKSCIYFSDHFQCALWPGWIPTSVLVTQKWGWGDQQCQEVQAEQLIHVLWICVYRFCNLKKLHLRGPNIFFLL